MNIISNGSILCNYFKEVDSMTKDEEMKRDISCITDYYFVCRAGIEKRYRGYTPKFFGFVTLYIVVQTINTIFRCKL